MTSKSSDAIAVGEAYIERVKRVLAEPVTILLDVFSPSARVRLTCIKAPWCLPFQEPA